MNMTEKKKAWLYLRGGTEKSLEAQKALLWDYANEAGVEVTDVAIDYSLSQSSLERVRMGAANQEFQVLLVSSWKRLGESLSEVIDTMTYLKDQNVAVHSAKERDMSLDQALSFARYASAIQLPDEVLSEEADKSIFEAPEDSEPFDMASSF